MNATHRPALRLLPWLLALAVAASAAAQRSLPIQATAEIDTAELPTTGRAVLTLRFTPETAIDAPYAVRVELRSAGQQVQRRDHAPPTATTSWRPGEPFEYQLSLFFPLQPKTNGDVDVLVGLLDPADGKCHPPLSTATPRDGMAQVAEFRFPELPDAPDAAAVEATVASALERARTEPRAAWDQLEFAFRRTDDYALKQTLQQALRKVGKMPPAELTFEERQIVQSRILDERARYLRQIAGRLFDRGQLFGALVLLDEVGGALQQDADRAVIGALDQARRATKDRDAIAEQVFALSDAQQQEVDRLAEQHTDQAERLKVGVAMAKDKARRAVARELVRTIEWTPELKPEAEAARREIERAWLADVPAAERAEADAALNHPSWARTGQRVSHRFVLIGPQDLLDDIPDDSLLLFDLAYLYQTDLFGRVPNPDGDRVTVYFKELWEFGGGIGGGKIIDVGRADPNAKKLRVDGGLYYHELGHCVDDTRPIYGGMREGLADFAAAFCYHELGQVAQARAAIGAARRAFLADYLERDLEYWRIPNYGPSAGFFLHFISEYGKDGSRYQWQRYRRFFRDYRDSPVVDGRTPTLARAFAFHLVEAFGEDAFGDLMTFRWPLVADDLAAIRLEQAAADRRRGDDGGLADSELSPVPRDHMARTLVGERAGPDDWSLELGVVLDWWVIGPFKKQGVDPHTYRFPPELEIDLGARYESINNNPTWRRPGPKPVTVDDSGWLRFHFSYMDDSAIYALTHVEVEQATDAWFHLRCDDDATLFVDDQLVGKYTGRNAGLGPWRPHWQILMPDAMRFAVHLEPGRHKVLLKVRNRYGDSGCSLAVTRRNGTPLRGWQSDEEAPAKKFAAIETPDGKRWRSALKLNLSRSGAHRKLDATVGGWRVRNKALEGTSTDRGVEWRKYTVRPGFPKDSPSNLAWLPEKATEDVDAFRLTIELEEGGSAPKLGVIFQGDGMRDALSGWTLLLQPRGDDRVLATLERYDREVYQSDVVPFDADPKKPTTLELLHFGKRLTVRLGNQTLFDQAPIRAIPDRHRIGITTWGSTPRLTEIELRAPARTR